MMTIYCTPGENGFQLKTTEPINGKKQIKDALSEGEAVRLAKAWNKLFVTETMMKWLNQRVFALRLKRNRRAIYLAEGLQDAIMRMQQNSDRHLYLLIVNSQHIIKEIAPGEKSGFHDHYKRQIHTIIEFCILNNKNEDHAA